VRSWTAVVLIAGITSAGRAQIISSTAIVQIPPAPQVQRDSDGRIIPLKLLPDIQQTSPSYMPGPQQNLATLKTNMWGESFAGALNPVRFEGHNSLLNDALSSGAAQWQPGLPPHIYDVDGQREESAGTRFKASSYVPLDSWIYPVFDRLAAMGYLPTSTAVIRPWTRLECARLLAEAHDSIDDVDDTNGTLLTALDTEFILEMNVIDGARNTGAQAESAYNRVTGIAGTPLRDSFHFGQTLVDDYGRPYGQGANVITGVSGRAEAGPLAFYIRGEYQYAAAMPAYNEAAQQAIAASDGLPFGWNLRFGTTSRARPIEVYASLNLSNWQISFGQQSLWWGPDRSTSLILSTNAAAMPMLRIDRTRPTRLPGPLSLLGPIHFDAFLARQGGIHYVGLGPTFILYGNASQPLTPPPYLWGIAVSIKPTENFEFGLAHTTIFAGYGRPLNLRTFIHSFSTTGNAQAVDPGKRVTEFNLEYHLPFLRRSVIVYDEGMAWDDPLQGKFVARYAMDPGVYLPRLPKLRKLDLRLEGVYTDLPKLVEQGFYYANAHYPQGYTNYGQILGSWIGRQGIGGEASSTYWLSARNKATISYRKMTSDKSLLQGGTLSDISGNVTWIVRSGVELSAIGQYEQWKFPLLGTGAKSNFTTGFEIRIFPKARVGSVRSNESFDRFRAFKP
jgi:Capsule assembly protein Wzi